MFNNYTVGVKNNKLQNKSLKPKKEILLWVKRTISDVYGWTKKALTPKKICAFIYLIK